VEWIFSHPVRPGPVFLAEMLTPIAANPIYWCAPLFVGFMYGFVYDDGSGPLATVIIGIPVTIAAACFGKALEIATILRFSRGRGRNHRNHELDRLRDDDDVFVRPVFRTENRTMSGLLGKIGGLFTFLPWPWLDYFWGEIGWDVFVYVGIGRLLERSRCDNRGCRVFSVWGAQKGLSGNVSAADLQPSRSRGKSRFAKNAVYRKEMLWFLRDRSAIVQAILVPLTVAVFQLFNFRWVLSHAQDDWNYLCGAAILFGHIFCGCSGRNHFHPRERRCGLR